MADYIDRQSAIDAFDGVTVDEKICDEYDIGYNDGIDFAVSTLSVLPSADVQPVHRRKWRYIITAGKHDYALECTACGRKFFHKHGDFNSPLEYNYCPFCGSKMEKGCYE